MNFFISFSSSTFWATRFPTQTKPSWTRSSRYQSCMTLQRYYLYLCLCHFLKYLVCSFSCFSNCFGLTQFGSLQFSCFIFYRACRTFTPVTFRSTVASSPLTAWSTTAWWSRSPTLAVTQSSIQAEVRLSLFYYYHSWLKIWTLKIQAT